MGTRRRVLAKDILRYKQDIDHGLTYVKLKNFVDSKIASGMSKDKIIEVLKSKGWSDDIVNSLF